MTPWDDANDEYTDVDDDDLSSDEFNEYEDERAALRGTSQCDGLCDPRCDWCLVAHHCPDECAGGPCPYDALVKQDTEPSEVQCLCQWEAGDSPCPLHGEEEVDPRP